MAKKSRYRQTKIPVGIKVRKRPRKVAKTRATKFNPRGWNGHTYKRG